MEELEKRLRRAMERLADNKVDSLLQLYSDIAQALDTIESLRASLTRVEEEDRALLDEVMLYVDDSVFDPALLDRIQARLSRPTSAEGKSNE